MAHRPNLAGDGSALILEDPSMSGTEAATDFIMDDSQIVPFLKQIGSTREHVPHFEVALTTNSLGASAGRPKVLALRKLSEKRNLTSTYQGYKNNLRTTDPLS